MKSDIHPFGIDQLPFGLSREEVRAALAIEPTSFRRAEASSLSEYYSQAGLFAYYDCDGRLEAAELTRPAQAILGGVDLLGLSLERAEQLLKRNSDALTWDSDGVSCLDLGIGVYAPLGKDDVGALVESVIVFNSGYYGRNC